MDHDRIFSLDVINEHLSFFGRAINPLKIYINFKGLRMAVFALDLTDSGFIFQVLRMYDLLGTTRKQVVSILIYYHTKYSVVNFWTRITDQ